MGKVAANLNRAKLQEFWNRESLSKSEKDDDTEFWIDITNKSRKGLDY
jgi:hypothetical protein